MGNDYYISENLFKEIAGKHAEELQRLKQEKQEVLNRIERLEAELAGYESEIEVEERVIDALEVLAARADAWHNKKAEREHGRGR